MADDPPDECWPISADLVLRKYLSEKAVTDVCALCACNASLLKIDSTNYVHLNDEYNDRRLTLLQLVKELQFDRFIHMSSPRLICESCVNAMSSFQLFTNKCRKITSGLNNFISLIRDDVLQKVVNVTTGASATVLPYKHIYQYSDIDGGKTTEFAEITEINRFITEIPEESQDSDVDDENVNRESELIMKGENELEYICMLCPAVKLTFDELKQHRLSHYYKDVTRSVILKKSFCICCLTDCRSKVDGNLNFINVDITIQNTFTNEIISLKEILEDVFSDFKGLGNVEMCEKCFEKTLRAYNFKKMFHASATIVQDCISGVEACLENPKSALTVTQTNENQSIGLLDVYSSFLSILDDRTINIAPFLKAMNGHNEKKTPKQHQIQRRTARSDQSNRPMTKKVAKNRYMCTICGRTSETLMDARDHRLDHCVPDVFERTIKKSEEPSVACHICGEEFVKPSDLDSHTRTDHNDLTFCPYCDKFYKDTRRILLKPHVEQCKNVVKQFKCDLCNASFINKIKAAKHRVRHFPQDVACEFCTRKFWTVRELKNHQNKIHRVLLGIKYECSMCSLDFESKTDRIKHYATHPPDSRHTCRFCKTTFRLKTNYIAHKCADKIIHMRKREQLLKHRKLSTTGIIAQVKTEPDDDLLSMNSMCDLCGKQFKTDRYLKAHRKTHEAPNDDSKKVSVKIRKHEGKLLLKYYKNVMHCESCNYSTAYPNCYEAHVNRQHRNVKPYSCELCSRRFYSKSNHTQHLKTHSMPKLLHCDSCGNKFSSKKALRLHTRLHTGEKPYPCDLCEEKFISASRRGDHRIRKHFDPTVPCKECFKLFYTQRELRMHISDYHLGQKKARLKSKTSTVVVTES